MMHPEHVKDTNDIQELTVYETPTVQIVSSGAGALITSVFVTPLDVVKTRLQAQEKMFATRKCFIYYNGLWDHICHCNVDNKLLSKADCPWYQRPGHFQGTLDAFIKIARYEGIASLWSGLPPTLLMAIPATMLYFTVYEQIRINISSQMTASGQPPAWTPAVAGATARVFTVTTISPIELVRTKLQSERISYLEIRKAVSALVKHQGILSLWRGWGPTILRDVPFSALYWTFYENSKRIFNQTHPTVLFSFVTGATAGTIAAVITLPFDVAKTHRQIELGEAELLQKKQRITTFHILTNLYRKGGIKPLFSGIVPRMIKVAPACAIMISTYETGKAFFVQRKRTQDSTKNVS